MGVGCRGDVVIRDCLIRRRQIDLLVVGQRALAFHIFTRVLVDDSILFSWGIRLPAKEICDALTDAWIPFSRRHGPHFLWLLFGVNIGSFLRAAPARAAILFVDVFNLFVLFLVRADI